MGRPAEARLPQVRHRHGARGGVFIAQAAHESGGFTRLEEDLNYSTKRLCEVWPKRFTPSLAAECAYKPEKIANIVYADRMGNGPPQSGDGSATAAAACFQLTGKRNYAACALALQTDLRMMPEYLATPDGAAMSRRGSSMRTGSTRWRQRRASRTRRGGSMGACSG
jgi:putative chitinase